ncbi:MAG TPA: glutathione peroxidase [Granulicella sp.]
MSSLYDIPLETINGEATTLAPYAGKVLLIVNVASQCGLTGQYEGLEKLYNTYKHCGFEILGFPANDFGAQEPGSNEEIQNFCTSKFNVTFPLFSKIPVTGPEKSPLYAALTAAQPAAKVADPGFRDKIDGFLQKVHGKHVNQEPEITWNFEKFLVNRKGEVVGRFAPDTLPDSPVLIEALEAVLPPL